MPDLLGTSPVKESPETIADNGYLSTSPALSRAAMESHFCRIVAFCPPNTKEPEVLQSTERRSSPAPPW
jgi:hypothetical protein